MAFEPLKSLEDQLDQLQLKALSQEDTKLRRQIADFSKSVYTEIELAFDDVHNLLSEIVNVRPAALSEDVVSKLTAQLANVHSSKKFKVVLEVCARLEALAKSYRKDINAVLVNSTEGYSELFWLLDKHEGLFRRTIEEAVDTIAKRLNDYRQGGDIKAAQALADDARRELKSHLERVRQARIAISGKTGGIGEILDLGKRADSILANNAWFNGSFYLATAIVLLGVLTFIAGSLDVFRLTFVVVGAYAGLALIGAYQLMNDGKISERGFLEAIRLSLTRVLLPIAKKAA